VKSHGRRGLIRTREGFERLRRHFAREMARDRRLHRKALDLLVHADHYHWIQQTTWLGEPVLQLPEDLFLLQEIIFKTRPKFIIEVGVAWGGSLLFYSTLLEAVRKDGRIIGIDVFVPPDLRRRVGAFGKISQRIAWIEGSSMEEGVIRRMKRLLGNCREVMVHLDSNHTHEHVLRELRIYSQWVGKGYYLICGDTVVEEIPPQRHRPRPWGPGNNPRTALCQFLGENHRFEVDHQLENKLLFSCNPGGYLKCRRDGPLFFSWKS